MFKWVSWVIRMGATALLLSFLCIWTTGYIVNSYMETVIKQLDLPLQTQPFAISGVWGKLWGAEEAPKEEASASSIKANEEVSKLQKDQIDDKLKQESTDLNASEQPKEPVQSPEPGAEASSSSEVDSEEDAIADPGVKNEDALPSPPKVEGDEGDGSTPVLGGQIEMEQLTDSERQALYAMVVSKLSQDQLKLLSDSLQDGLTAEELVQVQDMLKTALTDEEYSEMIKVLEGKQETNSDL